MSLTYSTYLRLDRLLALQDGASKEHDETLFIIIHQVYELWFKQILHELDYLAGLLGADPADRDTTPRILETLKRILTILKTLVGQVDVLETMTPVSFTSFRDHLETASGFQSPQFREVEFALGKRKRKMLDYHRENPPALERLEKRLAQPTVYQGFLAYLARAGYTIPPAVLEVYGEGDPPRDPEIRASLLRIYEQKDYNLMQICERLVDLDEGLQEWRYRHVKMVERTIGSKPGTGGSPGAAYLHSTLSIPLFPDLWAIRSDL